MLTQVRNQYVHCFKDTKGLLQGEYKEWHDNKQLKKHCFFVNGGKHGEYKSWYNNGQIAEQIFYVSNLKHGEYITWYNDGVISTHCFYSNNIPHGEYKSLWRSGEIYAHCLFVNGGTDSSIPLPTTPEDRMYFMLKYNIPLLPVENKC